MNFSSNFMGLIPKVEQANKVELFKPIMLSNFIFKVVMKIMATRLGNIASQILAPNQFRFVPRRNIHYCIALTSEEVYNMNKKGVEGEIALKVVIKRAFDTVE